MNRVLIRDMSRVLIRVLYFSIIIALCLFVHPQENCIKVRRCQSILFHNMIFMVPADGRLVF